MDNINSILLPHILEILSHKPDLRDTFDNLCHDIERQFGAENNKRIIKNMRKSVQKALNVGQSLGIITLTDEIMRMPNTYRGQGKHIHAAGTDNSINVNAVEMNNRVAVKVSELFAKPPRQRRLSSLRKASTGRTKRNFVRKLGGRRRGKTLRSKRRSSRSRRQR